MSRQETEAEFQADIKDFESLPNLSKEDAELLKNARVRGWIRAAWMRGCVRGMENALAIQKGEK